LTPKFSPGKSLNCEMLRSGLSSQSFRVDELDVFEPAVECSLPGPAGLSVFVGRALGAFFADDCLSFPCS
jgi:hypothetical protein